jgi:hypothetical protein
MGTKVGYARCSTDKQDLEANRLILLDLGVPKDRICLDRAYSGSNRIRPELTKPWLRSSPVGASAEAARRRRAPHR